MSIYDTLEVAFFNLIAAVQLRQLEIAGGSPANGNATVLIQTLFLQYKDKGGQRFSLQFGGIHDQSPELVVTGNPDKY
jgi:hypothetical protein